MNIRIPVSWLREYLKTDVAAKTLTNALSLSGPSVEKIEKRGEDHIFDIEVTTNRPDTLSVFGIAREAHAILLSRGLKSNLSKPKGSDLTLEPDTSRLLPLDVVIKNPNLCPRFTAIVVDSVKIKSSPAYIRNRLEASKIRSINNIVDISNYLMLELGQPMHTFDYDKILGAKMILRKSTAGEAIKTLDDTTRKLPKDSIVIEDEKRLIDLCGIMGGANSQVTKKTKRVVLFVQAYNPQLIRKTTQKLAFRTEAASRFEKGVDLEGILPALSRAVFLAKQTAEAKIASELIDIYPKKQKTKIIRLNLNKLNGYLGIDLEPARAAKILASLGFEATHISNQLITKPPSFRTQDMETDVDLIEEIARIHGYHNLPSKLPRGETPKTEESILKQVIELKKSLKFLGLTEIVSYSIISKNLLKTAGKSEKSAVELDNPLTEAWQFMRPTIIPSLLKIISENRHLKSDIRLFEIARTYLPQKNNLPKQDLILAICLNNTDFFDIKGLVENVFESLHKKPNFIKLNSYSPSNYRESRSSLSDIAEVKTSRQAPHQTVREQARTIQSNIFEKEQSAEIKVGNESIGQVGIVKHDIIDNFEIDTQIAASEINLTKIYQLPTTDYYYQPIPKYPPVIEDVSVVVAQVLPLAELVYEVAKSGAPLAKKIEVVDIFQDPKFGENKKSVTLRLYFQKTSSTTTLNEANKIKEKIVTHLEKTFRAKIRK